MAVSIMSPPSTATAHLLAALRASRAWQREAISETTETPVRIVARWTARDLDALSPANRREVEELLSVSSTRPWWNRAHA